MEARDWLGVGARGIRIRGKVRIRVQYLPVKSIRKAPRRSPIATPSKATHQNCRRDPFIQAALSKSHSLSDPCNLKLTKYRRGLTRIDFQPIVSGRF